MWIIGLLGGIGAGKSRVAQLFQQLGAAVINADTLAHEALKEKEIQRQITQLWGAHLLVAGEIDRRALARIVFPLKPTDSSCPELKKLENILHPVVRKKICDELERLAANKTRAVVLDVPLLWEGGLYKRCDILIFIDTPWTVRQQRLAQDRHWCEQDILVRQQLQADLAVKRAAAHHVIDNGKGVEETQQQVQTIWSLRPV